MTSVHAPFDGRIFHKQAKSLARAGYEVVLVARHERDTVVDGVRVVALPEPKGRIHRMTLFMRQLYKLALNEDADVYHFHDPELIVVGLLLKLHGKKVIWDVHEHYPNSIRDKFYLPRLVRGPIAIAFDIFERATVRFFDQIIYTTPLVGARYRRMKIPSASIENYPIIGLCPAFRTEPADKIVYLGVMSRIRGLVEVVQAFELVVRRHRSWELDLVGTCRPASFEHDLRKLARDRGLESNINFIEWVPYNQKERLLAEAAMGIVTYLPYANNTSCLPNKLFDYMLLGLPVIVSDFPLYRQVVQTHQCGLIVDPTRPEEIAAAMTFLIEHPEEARQMGQNGRLAVIEHYNWDIESRKLLSIYDNLLDAGAKTSEPVTQEKR